MSRTKTFNVYRYECQIVMARSAQIDTYEVDMDACGPMVLDALIKIKNEIDRDPDLPPLLPRRGVRFLRDEYRWDQNTLACTKRQRGCRR